MWHLILRLGPGPWGPLCRISRSFKPGSSAAPEELRDFITPKVARWWLPERVEFVEAIPKTAVGKYNKIALRQRFDSPGDHAAPQEDRA